MKDRIVLPLRPPDVECRSWCCDSSENESRLSVDCPFRIRVDIDIGGDGETRFSGDDSSAKLCNGGDVSELIPDFDPTKNNVENNISLNTILL